MDFLTSIPLPAALALLALLDGLSVGTLLIPLFFLIAPGRPRVARISLYLGTITLFYLAVGVLFTLGLVGIVDTGRQFLDSALGQTALLIVGVVLLVIGLLTGVSDSRQRKDEQVRAARVAESVAREGSVHSAGLATVPAQETTGRSGRILRWRDQLLADGTSRGTVVVVALATGLMEVATMLPYLIGMTLLADAPIGMPGRVTMLTGYCLVMIVPALALLAARLVAARVVDEPLQRLTAWMQRTGAENTAWILGILGFLLARAAATQLGISLPIIG